MKCCAHLETPHFSTVFHIFPITVMLQIEPLKPCWKQLPCKKKTIHYVHHNISDTKAHFVYPVSFRWAATCWESNWSELKCPGATRQKSELFFNQSINEKQGVKCWVTKKMKAIFVQEDSSIIEMIWYLWPVYTCFTNFLVRWHEEVSETGCTTKTSHSGVASAWKWNNPPIPAGVDILNRCAKQTAPNLEVEAIYCLCIWEGKKKTIPGIYNLCSSSACSCM